MKKYTIILLALAVLLPKISLAGTALGVTNITAVKTSAIANNTYADGWKWIFDVSVPTGEDKLQMKFLDWTNGAQSIPAGSNMHFYSAQSLNATSSGSAVSIYASNTYSSELILDPTKGQQVQVAVEIKVPTGTTGGSYSTSYGIQTTGTTTSELPVLNLRLSDTSRATGTPVYEGTTNRYDVFGIKAKDNTVVWVNDLSFKINIKEGYSPRAVIGEPSYVSTALGTPYEPLSNHGPVAEWISDDTIVFHNLNTRVSQNWVDFTLAIRPMATTSMVTMSTTLIGGDINAEDNSGVAVGVSGVEDITSNEITYAPKPATTLDISISPNTDTKRTVFGYDFTIPFTFNLKAQNDNVKITNLSALTTLSAGDMTTAYLYDGSTLLDSVTVVSGTATFSNLNLTISKDLIKELSLRIGGHASSTQGNLDVSVLASGITAVDSTGSTATTTGSAVFNTVSVQSAGVELSNPIINFTKTSIGNTSSSSFSVGFSFTAIAQGGEAQISSTDSIVIGIFVNGVRVTTATVGCSASPAMVSGNGYLIADGFATRLSTGYGFASPSEIYTPEGAQVSARLESVTTSLGTVIYGSDAYTTNSLAL